MAETPSVGESSGFPPLCGSFTEQVEIEETEQGPDGKEIVKKKKIDAKESVECTVYAHVFPVERGDEYIDKDSSGNNSTRNNPPLGDGSWAPKSLRGVPPNASALAGVISEHQKVASWIFEDGFWPTLSEYKANNLDLRLDGQGEACGIITELPTGSWVVALGGNYFSGEELHPVGTAIGRLKPAATQALWQNGIADKKSAEPYQLGQAVSEEGATLVFPVGVGDMYTATMQLDNADCSDPFTAGSCITSEINTKYATNLRGFCGYPSQGVRAVAEEYLFIGASGVDPKKSRIRPVGIFPEPYAGMSKLVDILAKKDAEQEKRLTDALASKPLLVAMLDAFILLEDGMKRNHEAFVEGLVKAENGNGTQEAVWSEAQISELVLLNEVMDILRAGIAEHESGLPKREGLTDEQRQKLEQQLGDERQALEMLALIYIVTRMPAMQNSARRPLDDTSEAAILEWAAKVPQNTGFDQGFLKYFPSNLNSQQPFFFEGRWKEQPVLPPLPKNVERVVVKMSPYKADLNQDKTTSTPRREEAISRVGLRNVMKRIFDRVMPGHLVMMRQGDSFDTTEALLGYTTGGLGVVSGLAQALGAQGGLLRDQDPHWGTLLWAGANTIGGSLLIAQQAGDSDYITGDDVRGWGLRQTPMAVQLGSSAAALATANWGGIAALVQLGTPRGGQSSEPAPPVEFEQRARNQGKQMPNVNWFFNLPIINFK